MAKALFRDDINDRISEIARYCFFAVDGLPTWFSGTGQLAAEKDNCFLTTELTVTFSTCILIVTVSCLGFSGKIGPCTL